MTSETPVGEDAKKELSAMVSKRYPDLVKNRLVWLEKALIVRTDNKRVEEMKESLRLKVGDVELVSRRVSGSISKLKRLASE